MTNCQLGSSFVRVQKYLKKIKIIIKTIWSRNPTGGNRSTFNYIKQDFRRKGRKAFRARPDQCNLAGGKSKAALFVNGHDIWPTAVSSSVT